MTKSAFLNALNSIAPFDTQAEWDNCGLQIDLGHTSVNKVLICMEISYDVIEEAVENEVDMIITHHPLLFNAVKKITVDSTVTDYIIKLITANIEVVSSHTCFDAAKGGNNDYLMNLMGVSSPKRFKDDCVRIGTLSRAVSFEKFICKLDEALGAPGIKFNGDLDKPIKTIVCCTGAGGEFVSNAIKAGADVFVSSDFKHHEAVLAKENGMCLVDAGHWGTEQIFVPNMAVKLKAKAKTLTVLMSSANQNPFSSII